MLLVVGLGNPGSEYASHRHNVGFMVVDELVRRSPGDALREKFSGVYAKAELAGEPCVLLKPMTYMNESGRSVQAAVAFFKVAPSDLIVLHDELDLPFGDVRLKRGGGHAGHNGLRSIMAHLGTPDFSRVRMGIGRPPVGFRGEVADFVLSSFGGVERALLPDVIARAADCIQEIAGRGFTTTMNARNTKSKPPKKPDGAPSPAPTGAPD